MVDKLGIEDSRVTWHTATIRRKTYHYMKANPDNEPVATIILLHGFPDLAFGWRYQIPCLQSHGYQIVAPDMLGFGLTSAPCQPSSYALRSIAEDIRDLAQLGIFSVGTPFIPPSRIYRSLDDVTQIEGMKSLRHQLQFQSKLIRNEITEETKVRQFLNAMFGAKGPENEVGLSTAEGILFPNLPKLNQSELLSNVEMDYYVSRYSLQGQAKLEGPLRWYHTRAHNYLDELRLLLKPLKFSMPALFLATIRDKVSPPSISEGMDQYFKNLTHREVDTSHWALWESHSKINEQIVSWLETLQ
ncbi:Alpha/Beta hydrolase protein [Fusarium flagelliforme]|uniref:Alpha/Beta hydrolase protein n=1 Tax=Fusarium flagelliforme TaxID=2675880 RepID=UPI001E8E16CA|nr:Alpha/Beta hydrolase protein [Fusarium flagelliforme]KAH7175179.1 Alpha/Beta hydrolase protein [Fusarium flagelliforme]